MPKNSSIFAVSLTRIFEITITCLGFYELCKTQVCFFVELVNDHLCWRTYFIVVVQFQNIDCLVRANVVNYELPFVSCKIIFTNLSSEPFVDRITAIKVI